ncbi:MAG TPA: hypothetical protein VFF78_00390 [Anaerolineaceae bacterium]|nr:hypothetical protein [Anaerolineaceae bacterium]
MRKLIAIGIVVILAFPLLMAALSVASVSTWVFDREFYTKLLDNDEIYQVLLDEQFPVYFDRRISSGQYQGIPLDALSLALRTVATPEYLHEQAMNIVNEAFDFFEGRDPTLDLYLDVSTLKQAILGEKGDAFARALVEALPVCKSGQEPTLPGNVVIRCIPTNLTIDEAVQEVGKAMPVFLQKVPDRIQLTDEPFTVSNRWGSVDLWMGVSGRYGFAIALLVLFGMALASWFVAALIASDAWKTRLLWLGWSMIVPAVLVFFIGLLVGSEMALNGMRYGLQQAKMDEVAYSPALQVALFDSLRPAVEMIANGFLMAGGIAGGLGVALLVWGISMPAPLPGMHTPAQPKNPQTTDGSAFPSPTEPS